MSTVSNWTTEEARSRCHKSKNEYFACLTNNNEDKDACADLKTTCKAKLSTSIKSNHAYGVKKVTHFEKKREFNIKMQQQYKHFKPK